ncbi:hypothetical protein ANRL1_03339 [Anaerolineae bacterium]|nr:hypothetical protein ANRL1_03339 [Anaerolineae bacterium]
MISKNYFPKATLFLCLVLLAVSGCNVAPAFSAAPPRLDDYDLYVVQPGDTVSGIATRHYVSIEQLIALNIETYPALARDPSLLQPGWRLRVPSARTVADARATAESIARQTDFEQTAKLIIADINNARAQRGQALLRADTTFTRIASDRSTDMIARKYFSHYDPQTAQQPLLRYLQAGKVAYSAAGENIAEIKNDAAWVLPWLTVVARFTPNDLAIEFVKGWLNSPEHRANIYSAQYRRTGVALSASGDARRIVATQVFSD